MKVGDVCLFVNEDDVWVRGRVVEWDTSLRRGMCIQEAYGSLPTDPVPVGALDLKLLADEPPDAPVDLADLQDLHISHALHAVTQRALQGHAVTRIGQVLLSLNPQHLTAHTPPPTAPEDVLPFIDALHATSEPPPHLWAQAAFAFDRMLASGRPQTLFPLGVGQAGQTEAAKLLNRYLCYAGLLQETPAPPVDGVQRGRLLGCANLVLECFGNARLGLHAPNASRFHRVTSHIYHARSGLPVGTRVSVHMLEHERVLCQGPHDAAGDADAGVGEETGGGSAPATQATQARSFHSFYALLQDAEKVAVFGLPTDLAAYRNLGGGAQHNRDFDTAEEAQEVDAALESLGFDEDAAVCLWGCLAAILHLQRTGMPDFASAADCVGVPADILQFAFSHGGMMGDTADFVDFEKLDYFCCVLYAAVFDAIVAKVNVTLAGVEPLINDPAGDTLSVNVFELAGMAFDGDPEASYSIGTLRLNASVEALAKLSFESKHFKGHVQTCAAEGVMLAAPTYLSAAAENYGMLTNTMNGVLQIVHQAHSARDAIEIMKRQYYSKSVETLAAGPAPQFFIDGDWSFCVNHFTPPYYTKYHVGASDTHVADPADFELVRHSSIPFVASLAPPAMGRSLPSFTREVSNLRDTYLSESLGRVGSVHHVLCCATTRSGGGYDQTYVAQQLGKYLHLSALLQMQKHGYPVQMTRREFMYLYGAPLKWCDNAQLRAESPSPQRRVFAPLHARLPSVSPVRSRSPTRPPPRTPSGVLAQYGVGVPYDAQVSAHHVFLMSHALRKLEAARHNTLREAAEVVQAFCVSLYSNVVTCKEQLRVAKADEIAEAKARIREQLRIEREIAKLQADDEPEARHGVEEDEVWDLLAIAGDFGMGFFDVYLAEHVRKEEEYRPYIEQAEAEEFLTIFNEYSAYEMVLLQANEALQRAEILREEDETVRQICIDEFWDKYAEMWRQREEDEEAQEREMHEHLEMYDRATLEVECLERRKPLLQYEERQQRGPIIREEQAAWDELLDELEYVYRDVMSEELLEEEELARFGYRGVGGIVVEEAEAWKQLCTGIAQELARSLAAEALGEQPGIEQASRQAIAEEETEARASLKLDYINESAPHKAHYVYSAAMHERGHIERAEEAERSAYHADYVEACIDLLLQGRGHESEPTSRRIIEKLQRDAKRRLIGFYKRLFLQLEEERYRTVMQELDDLQREEIVYRKFYEGKSVARLDSIRVKFELEKKKWLSVYSARIADRMERDARGDEFTRRHYLQLTQARANADRLNGVTVDSVARSLDELSNAESLSHGEYSRHRAQLAQQYHDDVRRRASMF